MVRDKIWIEKYRPLRLDDVVGQDDVIKRIKSYIQIKNLPHLMFSGPPGTGKTATAVSLARELFGDEWTNNFMELNSSDERKIETVRNKIKNFARSSTIGDAEFKIIFLDESDALTDEAQSALRRIMENYTEICRFILSCNYSSKVIEPIQSRCAVYRFRPLLNKHIEERVRYIAKKEGINLTKDGMEAIIFVAQGDMRKAINALQGATTIEKIVDGDSIYQVTSTARPEDIIGLIQMALQCNLLKTRSKLEYMLNDQGLSGKDIVKQMYRIVLDMTIPDKSKIDILDYLGEIDFRISEGADEKVQLGALVSRLMLFSMR